jgi:molybdopterin/thiamine biosynthesis adenylyltransferase
VTIMHVVRSRQWYWRRTLGVVLLCIWLHMCMSSPIRTGIAVPRNALIIGYNSQNLHNQPIAQSVSTQHVVVSDSTNNPQAHSPQDPTESELRYSRQLLVHGAEAQRRIEQGSVVLVGDGGLLTAEIAKNLALSGIGHIWLCRNVPNEASNRQDEVIKEQKKQLDSIVELVHMLNPSVTCAVCTPEDIVALRSGVGTESSGSRATRPATLISVSGLRLQDHFQVHRFCRQLSAQDTTRAKATKFVGATIRGTVGCLLVDSDSNNYNNNLEEPLEAILSLSSESNGPPRFRLMNDCAVKRKDLLKSMLLLAALAHHEAHVRGPLSMSTVQGRSLHLSRFMQDAIKGIVLDKWLSIRHSTQQHLPRATVDYCRQELQTLIANYNDDYKNNPATILDVDIRQLLFSLQSDAQDPTLVTVLAAMCAHTAFNHIISPGGEDDSSDHNSKDGGVQFMMLDQLYASSLLSDNVDTAATDTPTSSHMMSTHTTRTINNNILLTPLSADSIARVYGAEVAKELMRLRVCVAGAGAIGCELLKLLSQLNVGTHKAPPPPLLQSVHPSTSMHTFSELSQEEVEVDAPDDDSSMLQRFLRRCTDGLSGVVNSLNPFYSANNQLMSTEDIVEAVHEQQQQRQTLSHSHEQEEEEEDFRDGHIVVIDNDIIEVSNMHRQFLFQSTDIHKSKAQTAVLKLRDAHARMNEDNKNSSLHALTLRLGPESEHTYLHTSIHTTDDHAHTVESMEELFLNTDVVMLALDNVEARNYVDKQCIKYTYINRHEADGSNDANNYVNDGANDEGEECVSIPSKRTHTIHVIDAGTVGAKGSTQTVIPTLTETYSSQSHTQDGNENIPVCTIKSFPTHIDHCIIWSKEVFQSLFQQDVALTNECLQWVSTHIPTHVQADHDVATKLLTRDWLQGKLDSGEMSISDVGAVNHYLRLLMLSSRSPEGSSVGYRSALLEAALKWAVQEFNRLFKDSIEEILRQHPVDSLDEDGQTLFWSGYASLVCVCVFH